MKKLFALALVCLACWGCDASPKSDEKIVITTSIGRKVPTTRRYTMKEIEAGSEASASATVKNPFDIQHPVYPTKEQIGMLREHLRGGGDVWYFEGLDSGWAIVKSRAVVWVLVTSHEY